MFKKLGENIIFKVFKSNLNKHCESLKEPINVEY